jgi:hypothetical protein
MQIILLDNDAKADSGAGLQDNDRPSLQRIPWEEER